MGIGDIFKASQNQALTRENFALKTKIDELESLLTPEHNEIIDLTAKIKQLKTEKVNTENDINNNKAKIKELELCINNLKDEMVQTEETVLLQSFGLYEPTYDFATSDEYKNSLQNIRELRKNLIKNGLAVTGNTEWTVNGNATKGRKMVADMQKLLLRAFNTECDELIDKVKYNNYDSCIKRIEKSCTQISKLGSIMGIAITETYKNNRTQELTLAFEYEQKKQQEKEEQKELKARMREEAKLQKEIEAARKKLEKEHNHYLNALQKLDLQIKTSSDSEKDDIIAKKQKLLEQIEDTEKAIKDVDYREANKRAGYVYVISNIGAFGENIYKIGMTRRLDPMERVYELGDASVPFNFDVHAMIFTDDAPKLENALHKAFEDKKVNMVNHRREFFNVSLDEIKRVIKENYDKTVEFVDLPSAEQYRISEKMRKEIVNV